MDRMFEIASNSDDERNAINATKTILAADGLNVKRESASFPSESSSVTINVDNRTQTVNVVAVAVQEAMRSPEYLEYLESRRLADGGDAGTVCGNSGPQMDDDSPPDAHFPRIGPRE